MPFRTELNSKAGRRCNFFFSVEEFQSPTQASIFIRGVILWISSQVGRLICFRRPLKTED